MEELHRLDGVAYVRFASFTASSGHPGIHERTERTAGEEGRGEEEIEDAEGTGAGLMNDRFWMKRALGLAEKGRGRTSPNPMVGAVLVKENRVLGGRLPRQGRKRLMPRSWHCRGPAASARSDPLHQP